MCFLLPCSLFRQTVSTASANGDNFTISSLELLRDLSHQTFTAVEMHCSEHRRKFKISAFLWQYLFLPQFRVWTARSWQDCHLTLHVRTWWTGREFWNLKGTSEWFMWAFIRLGPLRDLFQPLSGQKSEIRNAEIRTAGTCVANGFPASVE